jgi:hypothetical protein
VTADRELVGHPSHCLRSQSATDSSGWVATCIYLELLRRWLHCTALHEPVSAKLSPRQAKIPIVFGFTIVCTKLKFSTCQQDNLFDMIEKHRNSWTKRHLSYAAVGWGCTKVRYRRVTALHPLVLRVPAAGKRSKRPAVRMDRLTMGLRIAALVT